MTILTKHQVKTFGPRTDDKLRADYGATARLTVDVRYDDRCNNGHNSFSITGDIRVGHRIKACGCLHDDIIRLFPELAQYVKWHLTSSDGPLHYIANTVYHVNTGRLDYARNSAVWPDARDIDLTHGGALELEQRLIARMPALGAEFRTAMETLGFKY
jgi:hypothetical protein